jgi:hypothetical protein
VAVHLGLGNITAPFLGNWTACALKGALSLVWRKRIFRLAPDEYGIEVLSRIFILDAEATSFAFASKSQLHDVLAAAVVVFN